MSTRKGDYRPRSGPRYSEQAYDLRSYGVYDHWLKEWVTGHYFTGRQRYSQAKKAAKRLNEQDGGRS